jgi:hypothetical protein
VFCWVAMAVLGLAMTEERALGTTELVVMKEEGAAAMELVMEDAARMVAGLVVGKEVAGKVD